jgi:hypothetical protein
VDRIHWLVESTTMENNSMEKGKAQNLLRRDEVPDVFLCLLGVFVINIGYLAWTGRMPAIDGMADDQIMNTIAVLLLSGGTLCWVGFRQLLAPNRRCDAATGGSEMGRPLKITAFFALLVVAQALLVHFMGW